MSFEISSTFYLTLLDVIGITETRLHEEDPLVNIDIEGYEFRHTPTTTQCGGAGIYVKSCYEFDINRDLSQSISDVSESIFIELEKRWEEKSYNRVHL